MSLFKSREWWAVNLNENEMYDSQCLLISTLGKEGNQSILLGNHEGLLRLFSVNSDLDEEGFSGYKPSHLLLEVQLSSPILQLKEGTLVSGSQETFLAVLHSKLFSVYALRKKESKDDKFGDQMLIELAYQHTLRHSAHSFVLGSFGGVRERTFSCIMSLDGLVSFYEQESFAFQLYLPTFILPFTFSYLEKIDSFLFLNSSLILDCYSYEALAEVGNSNDKKIAKTWELNLGEGILDIQTVIKDILIIILLSEKNLIGLSEKGKMIFMKRFEFRPVVMCSYLTEEDKKLIIIIATDGNFLNVYEETNLKWSMKIDFMPVSINRIFLQNLPGGLVLLSENGYLQIVYIGTHPSVYLVPQLHQPEIDIQKAQVELRNIQQKIKENDILNPITASSIDVRLVVDKNLKMENGLKTCNVKVEINVECQVTKMQVLFMVEPPLTVTNQCPIIDMSSEKIVAESSIYLSRTGIVSNLMIKVSVIYVINEGSARFVLKEAMLPLDLILTENPPVKEGKHKITILTNKPICGMNQLFREFPVDENSPHVIGLRFLNSKDVVTILAAKSSQRYRLQSDCLAAISLLVCVLVERLRDHYRKDSDFSLTCTVTLPLDTFFETIQHRHKLIERGNVLQEKLTKESSQYRTVQKKILNNLKGDSPKSITNLHKILKDTHNNISSSIIELEEVEEELFLSKTSISALSRMLIILLELMAVGEKDLKLVKLIFNPNIHDTDKQGWLEVQEAAASYLLRTKLAKSTKDQQKPTDILLESMSDPSKFVKHLSSVIDRVTKGTHLLERNEFETKKEPLSTIQSTDETEENFLDETIPVGFKYVALETSKTISSVKSADVSSDHTNAHTKQNDDSGLATEAVVDKKSPETEVEKRFEEKPLAKSEKREESEKEENSDDDAIWDVKVGEMEI